MSFLLVRPKKTKSNSKILDITPKNAGWKYVGFAVHQLKRGQQINYKTLARENIIVLIEGKAELCANEKNFGVLGKRLDVFEKKLPAAIYVPNNSHWTALAKTNCTLAICSAPSCGNYPPCQITNIKKEVRGRGSNKRFIHPIAMEDKTICDSLLVTEVFTPSGNWSSYPPHRHDENNFPHITYLEETYYHRLQPKQGFGFQRVFTEDGKLDETITVHDGDVVLVPKGHHPYGSPYGYETYYLNVMAGPIRKWRFKNHPDHKWIVKKDKI